MLLKKHKHTVLFSVYFIVASSFFLLLLGILASVTNTWLYFSILSEKTDLSVEALANIHYGFMVVAAFLWAFNGYKHSHETHKKLKLKKNELLDHNVSYFLKTLILPFLALLILNFIIMMTMISSYGKDAYEVRMALPNDPTIYEFISLVESVALAIVAVAFQAYLIKKFLYWTLKD